MTGLLHECVIACAALTAIYAKDPTRRKAAIKVVALLVGKPHKHTAGLR